MADGNTYAADNENGAENLNNALSTPPPPPNNMMAVLKSVIREGYPEIMDDAIEAAREDARREDAMPPPPPKPTETRQVELIFNGSGGESVTFKLNNTMKLRKAMEHYSAKVQRPVDQLRFLFEGQRLGSDDTPAAHEMEDGDIVEVHMEQLGGGLFSKDEDWEDWVVVVSDEELFQQTLEEKARLCCLISRLKNEISALKANNRELMTNNRAFAKENNSLKTEKTELNDDNSSLFTEFTKLLTAYKGLGKSLDRFKTIFDRETSALKASIAEKDRAIDAILRDFQFTMTPEGDER